MRNAKNPNLPNLRNNPANAGQRQVLLRQVQTAGVSKQKEAGEAAMKISNSKKQLAKIISENGGWFEGAGWAIQGRKTMVVGFSKSKPYRKGDGWFVNNEKRLHHFDTDVLLPSWHQTIISRDEYSHLYPAPDADGWIEWNGGECPVDGDSVIDVKLSDGDEFFGVDADWDWHQGSGCDIIAYRLHKPNLAETEYCESVMRSIPEPETNPTIEQLSSDYRNLLDFAERKQQEADAAKADAEAKLAELVAAGKALGLVLSVAAPDPKLVITDWRDLQVGDIIECLPGSWRRSLDGRHGRVVATEVDGYEGAFPVRVEIDGEMDWGGKFKFIRRP